MRFWQGCMIALARSGAVTRFMQDLAPTSGLASRFVAGAQVADAIAAAQRLKTRKLTTSAFFLGEYVSDREKVETNVAGILAVIEAIDGAEVDLHISVDPSQVGYAIDDDLGADNTLRIARAIKEKAVSGRKTLMLDMEDEDYVQRTIELHDHMGDNGYPVAITVQAYLRRSEADVRALAKRGAMVRLVKGAFVGSKKTAFITRADIDASYRRLASLLLSTDAKNAGAYPVFGPHDDKLIAALREEATGNGWKPGTYEFEMLFGVRPSLQESLTNEGCAVRLYLPFGRDWWPYAVRRIGENPRNAWLVVKALIARQ
ncbi:MAG: proline dehydrogenase family protein [Alphaproteobacteria bacterium]|nr:proline dehydrogenase family protein [Alphaproteobacteria bacterium]